MGGTPSLGITYGGRPEAQAPAQLHAGVPVGPVIYCDADFAGDKDKRVSRTGCVVMDNGGPIFWYSKLQGSVAVSTMEAEYMAADVAVREAMYQRKLQPLLTGAALASVPILTDSECALGLLANPQNTARSKHIDVKYHYARERALAGDVVFHHVPGALNVADILTKPSVGRAKFDFCVAGMGMS